MLLKNPTQDVVEKLFPDPLNNAMRSETSLHALF